MVVLDRGDRTLLEETDCTGRGIGHCQEKMAVLDRGIGQRKKKMDGFGSGDRTPLEENSCTMQDG